MKTHVLMFEGLLALMLAQADSAQAPGFQTVGTVRQIMLGIVAPAADVMFKAPNRPPKDDDAWTIVQNSALTLAEAGNLLMIPARTSWPNRRSSISSSSGRVFCEKIG